MSNLTIGATIEDTKAVAWGPGNREWWYPRLLSIAVLAVMTGGVWMYQHRNDPLRTQRLEIVNAQGKVCAVLGATTDGQTGLVLQDANGAARAAMSLNRNGNPALTLCSPEGVERAGIEISPGGHSTLRLLNEHGQVRVAVEVKKDGRAAIKVTDMYGKSGAALTLSSDDKAGVTIHNQGAGHTENAASIHAGKAGLRPRISLLDASQCGAHHSGGHTKRVLD